MEGVGAEAASLAGHLELRKLICLYDDNHVTLSAGTDITFTEDRAARFRAYGWHTIRVDDGNDLAAIESALTQARAETQRPSLILYARISATARPSRTATNRTVRRWVRMTCGRRSRSWTGRPSQRFSCPRPRSRIFGRHSIAAQKPRPTGMIVSRPTHTPFRNKPRNCKAACEASYPPGGIADIPLFPADAKGIATREASGKIMNAIAPKATRVDRRFGRSGSVDEDRTEGIRGFQSTLDDWRRHSRLRGRRLELCRPQPALWRA